MSFSSVIGRFLVGALLVVAVPGATSAADEAGRYSWVETSDGLMRLDRETGAVSRCAADGGEWRCRRVADEGMEDISRIDELESEVSGLRAEIARLEAQLEQRGRTASVPQLKVPDERQMDEAFEFLEGTLKRFRGLVEQLEGTPSEGTPL